MIRSVREKLKNNSPMKGFTLVELIVVLVILAILAAVAIPALLGFTDSAREKRYISDANAALKASQTVITEVYNEGGNLLDGKKRYKAWQMAGVDKGAADANIGTFISSPTSWPAGNSEFIVWTGKKLVTNETAATSANTASYTVTYAQYTVPKEDGKKVVFYNGKEWKVYDDFSSLEKTDDYKAATSESSIYKDNKILMWPNYAGCDTAYKDIKPETKTWIDRENGEPIVRHVTLVGFQKGNHRGLFFKSESTGEKKYSQVVDFMWTLAGTNITWTSEDTIETGYEIFKLGLDYKTGEDKSINSTDGYYIFQGWRIKEADGTYSGPYTYEQLTDPSGEYVARLQNAQSDDDPALTLYAMGYQTYYSVDVTFKVNNPDTLSFKSGNTTERTITFRKYWNTELDYSANGDMVDPTGKDIYPCELNDEAWDNNPDDMNCKDDPGLTFTGEWAFYSGGFNGAGDTGYEKEGEGNNVNIPVTYATISDIWKKVFENYTPTPGQTGTGKATFNFVGAVKTRQTVNLVIDGDKAHFRKLGSTNTLPLYLDWYELAPSEYRDTFGDYVGHEVVPEAGYRHTGWVGTEGYMYTVEDKGIDSIHSIVESHPNIYSFTFKARIENGSGTMFIGKNINSTSNFASQINSLSLGSKDNVKALIYQQDYAKGLAVFEAYNGGALLEKPEDSDDLDGYEAVSCGAAHSKVITDGVSIPYADGGRVNALAILWDGKDDSRPQYDVPAFAYSVQKSDGVYIYWFSRESHPALEGDFSNTFQNYSSLTFEGSEASGWNTAPCIDMKYMFAGSGVVCNNNCISFASWEYGSVTSMQGMFKDTTNLSSISFADKDLSRVTSTMEMFSGSSVGNVGFSANLGSLTTTEKMFYGCTSLSTADFSTANFSSGPMSSTALTNVSGMFQGCTSLESINVSAINTSIVTDASHMFDGCTDLETVTVLKSDKSSDFTFADSLTTVAYMFNNCHNLTGLDLRGFGECSSLTNISFWFYKCYHIKYIDLGNFEPAGLTNISSSFVCVGKFDGNTGNNNLTKDDGCKVFAKGKWGCTDNCITVNSGSEATFNYFRVDLYGTVYKNSNDVNKGAYGIPEKIWRGSTSHLDIVLITDEIQFVNGSGNPSGTSADKRIFRGYFMYADTTPGSYYEDWKSKNENY